MSSVPATSFRVVCAVAVLNANGIVLGWLTQIMAGGSVTIDSTAENLRTCSFSCLDPAGILTPLWPSGGYLQPDGTEIKIYAGYMVDGVTTLYAQGIFGISQVDVVSGSAPNAPGPVLNVTGTDRSTRLSRALFTDAFSIANGTTVSQAVLDVLAKQAPWCTTTNIAPTTHTVATQMFQPGDDPMQGIQEMCASAGQVAFFDREGIFTVINDPSANPTTPTALFIDGAANTATSVTRTTSNTPGYNGVIVTGQAYGSSSAVISGSAFDSDPASPQYYLGSYGEVPAPPVQASTVTSDSQAAAMAHAILPQVLGMTRQVVVDTVPCFWIDAFDLFKAVNKQTQTNGVFIVEQATIPLDYSTLMALTGVPLGTPVNQFDGLSNAPSVAAYAPVSNGAFNYNPTTGTYTYGNTTSGSGSTLGAGGFGALGFGGFGLGMFGLGNGINPNGNIISRILRDGNGGYTIKRDASGIETVVRDAEKL